MRRPTILVTGATGFLGGHVVAALRRSWSGGLRLLSHVRGPPAWPAGEVEVVRGSLEDAASLRLACEGVSRVVHAACHVGDDPVACEAVNARGTALLVEEAQRAGVERLVYLSTTAVYGWAVHAGASEQGVTVAPATPISRSRARAERAVLGRGGIVLRPTFVYGTGDTRFVPAILAAVQRLPFLVAGGRARLSVIDAADLGRAVAALVTAAGPVPSGAYHANDLAPVAFGDIVRLLARHLGTPMPRWSVPYPVARWILRLSSRSQWTPSTAHRIFLVTHDHHYDASALWSLVSLAPGAPLTERIVAHLPWYRRFVGDRGMETAA